MIDYDRQNIHPNIFILNGSVAHIKAVRRPQKSKHAAGSQVKINQISSHLRPSLSATDSKLTDT